MLIVQSAQNPTRIRNALVDLVALGVVELHVASAYVTQDASRTLLNSVRCAVGPDSFNALPKRLVASLDFGLTQPEALQLWKDLPCSEVHVAGADAVMKGQLKPISSAFHPKMYLFKRSETESGLLVGSANLTSRGLAVNTEVAWREDSMSSGQALYAFHEFLNGTVPLSDEILHSYAQLRARQPAPREVRAEVEHVDTPAPVNPGALSEFRHVVDAGAIDLAAFEQMWVQGEGMQGGSRNQLELPRGAHRFFRYNFDGYSSSQKETIGSPVLKGAGKIWDDRLLTWHGNNMMERLNLPTVHKGGFVYSGTAVMFRRLGDGSYELAVVPWDSDLAMAWRQASADRGLLFKLGHTGSRLVGLL